ncbi:MAG: SAM-dependent methyltransferase [Anaerovoracaceae bacterium]
MLNILKDLFQNDTLISLTLANKRKKSIEINKIVIRPIDIKGSLKFQWEFHQTNKVTHKNLSREESFENLISELKENYKQCNIFSTESDIQILASKFENPKIIKKKATKEKTSTLHNKEKNYIIPLDSPCDFLIKLGVMDSQGKVHQKHYSKFRQINRFLEIVSDVYPSLPAGKVKIIDFGCGKAYLTFALYYYLKILQNRQVEIVGLDLKKDVIDFCNSVAQNLGYNELIFEIGDIAKYQDTSCHMVVTLHACDTATDYALINAVKWNTNVILSVPCCQHELFKQIDSNTNNPILKYGLNKDKFTEVLTNGLRALKLEEASYNVSMVEFTSLEHTAKNVMIKAIKTKKLNVEKSSKARTEFNKIVMEYNVNPTISLLNP